MKTIRIYKRRDGTGEAPEVLYEGRAESRKAFIEDLVQNGHSLAGADLGGADLEFLDLEGADLTGALLDKTSFRGTNLLRAKLRGASLRDAKFHGANAKKVRFQGADLTDADLQGATLTNANFRGAILDNADFAQASCGSAVFTYVRAKEAKFSSAQMGNTDFGNSRLIKCDFSGTNLSTRGPIEEEHLPDRTRNAVIVGCTYDKGTRLSPTLPLMSQDRGWNKVSKSLFWGASSLAFLGLASAAPAVFDENEDMIRTLTGSGIAFVSLFTAKYLFQEWAVDQIKDRINECLHDVRIHLIQRINSFRIVSKTKTDLAVAMCMEKSVSKPLMRLLATVADDAGMGEWKDKLHLIASDLGNLIICDRKNLAMALAAISANRDRNYHIPRDIVVMRSFTETSQNEQAPACMRFMRAGGMVAAWQRDGEMTDAVIYGGDGRPRAHIDLRSGKADEDVSGISFAATMHEASRAFENQVLEESGLGSFDYPRDTHYIQAGRDGTIIVRKSENRRVDNPAGPAAVYMDESSEHFRNGEAREPDCLPAAAI